MTSLDNGKSLTVVFTDVEGSTELLSREGDEIAGEILRTHEDIVRRHILECGGREEAFLGDGFMATFETPSAAVTCATHIQRSLQRHNEKAERPVRVRIGMHVGEVTRRGGQIYGQTVHAAARVMGEAAGAQTFVSEAVKATLGDASVPLTDRGLFWLKGFPSRWRLYEVQWGEADEPATARGRGGA